MKDRPFVSIIINNYNYEQFLCEAIDSALNQTYPYTEVIVVDDGSLDNSRKPIDSYGNKIVSILKKNGGQASALNAGFAASKGKIICFLDADDYYSLNKIDRVIELFLHHPDAGWLFHALNYVDAKGKCLKLPRKKFVSELVLMDLRQDIVKGNVLPYFPATSGLCFKRDLLRKILPMPEAFTISADSFLRLAAIYLSPGMFFPENLGVHRIHGANLYEFNPNLKFLDGEVNIKTSYYLREKFPETKLYANRLYAYAMGSLAGQTNFVRAFQLFESRKYIKHYLSFTSWLTCLTRIFYNYAKVISNK